MFQISRRVDYAVRIMIELGMQPEGVLLSARRLSAKTAVPKAFLHKITADLVRAGLILTQTGPSGGLALQKPANDVSLLDVVEAIDGPVCLNICLVRPQECNRDRFCPGHEVWGKLQLLVVNELRKAILADLVEEAWRLQKNPRSKLIDFPYVQEEAKNGATQKEQIN
ncbi:MAG: Rrf2 family transcriptional regulator [Ardenticatenaceae bacterium]|nr:Rrf2 family transcriptional regulator [Anaerolineales bacterium]MCB8940845.1 Rrf2 family transcriptional regulator [Ardenticatenaceae bacterium]MCB8972184.1 Rrf2 family transcriptional regulator [Ardenticatenaceae bacterium]